MKEELLHFIWQSKLLLGKPLTTIAGDRIHIRQLGKPNRDAGPDFTNAKIELTGTLWAGNIEIHVRSSDWELHKHQNDLAYNNVILHVVYYHDKPAYTQEGRELETLELRQYIPGTLLAKYAHLEKYAKHHIPCEAIAVKPDLQKQLFWYDRLLVERIETRFEQIQYLLDQTQSHWEESYYRFLMYYLGMKINAQPMALLAAKLPLNILTKHQQQPELLLALVIGVSSLWNKFEHSHKAELISLFKHYAHKYNLEPMESSIWKFSQTRPGNFPTARLFQFSLLFQYGAFHLPNVLACSNTKQLEQLFTLPAQITHSMGRESVRLLLVNAVLPFVFAYGKHQHQPELMDKALQWYTEFPPEKNAITRQFKTIQLIPQHAGEAQALIQLKNAYCNSLRCLHCAIGHQTLLYV
ncbi:MAG: DUF2851 family protein [Bacteroidia bacterium]|jgi:hypothetical protein|nr:DUF2851 family protein [Bacteroidia bacterium]